MSTPRHTARAIVIHDDRLLLMERWRPGYHYFSIPGGGIETSETAEQAAVREVQEETCCQVEVVRQLYFMRLDGNEHQIFLCRYVSGEPRLPDDSPEAALGPDNRFQPCWMPLGMLSKTPFLIWQPVKEQLLHDLAKGFAEQVVEISAEASR